MSQKFKVKTELVWKHTPKGIMIEPGLALNSSAANIFLLLQESRSQEELTELLAREYNLSAADLADDVSFFLDELKNQNLIENINYA